MFLIKWDPASPIDWLLAKLKAWRSSFQFHNHSAAEYYHYYRYYYLLSFWVSRAPQSDWSAEKRTCQPHVGKTLKHRERIAISHVWQFQLWGSAWSIFRKHYIYASILGVKSTFTSGGEGRGLLHSFNPKSLSIMNQIGKNGDSKMTPGRDISTNLQFKWLTKRRDVIADSTLADSTRGYVSRAPSSVINSDV